MYIAMCECVLVYCNILLLICMFSFQVDFVSKNKKKNHFVFFFHFFFFLCCFLFEFKQPLKHICAWLTGSTLLYLAPTTATTTHKSVKLFCFTSLTKQLKKKKKSEAFIMLPSVTIHTRKSFKIHTHTHTERIIQMKTLEAIINVARTQVPPNDSCKKKNKKK